MPTILDLLHVSEGGLMRNGPIPDEWRRLRRGEEESNKEEGNRQFAREKSGEEKSRKEESSCAGNEKSGCKKESCCAHSKENGCEEENRRADSKNSGRQKGDIYESSTEKVRCEERPC